MDEAWHESGLQQASRAQSLPLTAPGCAPRQATAQSSVHHQRTPCPQLLACVGLSPTLDMMRLATTAS